MHYILGMTSFDSLYELLEYNLGLILRESPFEFEQLQKISSSHILNDQIYAVIRLKALE